MLIMYRRHGRKCANRSRKSRRCSCMVWVQGTIKTDLGMVPIRKSLNTTDWDKAARIMNEMESGKTKADEPDPVTILQAKERYIVAIENRNLAPPTEKKYKLLMRQLEDFCEDHKLVLLKDINLETVRAFLTTLKDGPLAKTKKIDRLKNFFTFCLRAKWIDENPAQYVDIPIVRRIPTLPFTDAEVGAITGAAEGKTKAFVLLMLYSGLRISDAALLHSRYLVDNKLFLRQEKTGEPVYVPLPPFLVHELKAIPLRNGYFFTTGSCKKETVANNWRRRLEKVFQAAEVQKAHPHRFRDTFAVNLLNKGVSMENVSKLLGHTSIKITEKHYAPFVKKLRQRLEEEVRKTW
jgi:integrase/recombinase XerD